MAGLDFCVYLLYWDIDCCEAKIVEKLFCVEKQFKNHTIGQAKCDSTGRLYFGTFDKSKICDPNHTFDSNLYSFDRYGLQKVASDYKIAAGLAWSTKGNYLYSIESCAFNIQQFKWNPHTGKLCK